MFSFFEGRSVTKLSYTQGNNEHPAAVISFKFLFFLCFGLACGMYVCNYDNKFYGYK